MTVAYLGLGANLGDARQTLKDAVVCLAQQHTIAVLAKSSLYRTAPIDAGGDDYFNCVVKIDTTLTPHRLLALCQQIEHHFGRERPYRNAPRTLDIDILLFDEQSIEEPDLIVPHPRLTERAFVLVPLLEIDAALTIPQQGRADTFLAHVADQRIEKMKSPCQCPMLNALSANDAGEPADAANGASAKGRCS
ncbi:2-amino-4-hydroxy-6-hydroxymethyldihydropteridine diphosphokinase [Paraburkholderia sp.]|uniref:2-amino-4-hydroxy-6- hydroxymethyldihydropteridine diphosphokinase n=1 Tax=Paraburkholderia sp. TaxID=1926495 RepID=UPI00238B639D|nr:2-amino-4-hydroxy-6-hydroxymethyldihydropteridine diphosphokinase [Paraburkholderia sp.]MDE1183392.1 2-amino-4-hydroxy-6-hydroxymethyldihydropteridine diphosphokinase [Paraburkholderia sp.]